MGQGLYIHAFRDYSEKKEVNFGVNSLLSWLLKATLTFIMKGKYFRKFFLTIYLISLQKYRDKTIF